MTHRSRESPYVFFFFFNDPAPTEIHPLPPHAPLPIGSCARQCPPARAPRRLSAASSCRPVERVGSSQRWPCLANRLLSSLPSLPRNRAPAISAAGADRKSTRLNSSHLVISYAVFCLKK